MRRAVVRVEGDLILTLMAEPEVTAGKHTFLRLMIEPSSDFERDYTVHQDPFDFYARDMDGEVWRLSAEYGEKPMFRRKVPASRIQPLLFRVEWDVTDFDGTPLEPGDYVIGGQFEFIEPIANRQIESAPLKMTVLPAEDGSP